jgi:predicted signal transduction protein with EAL and GGDEF domain
MYAAKRAGGNTYAFFEPRMELDAREQLALQNDLRHAIERHELQLHYQPKIDGRPARSHGVEALLRWIIRCAASSAPSCSSRSPSASA